MSKIKNILIGIASVIIAIIALFKMGKRQGALEEKAESIQAMIKQNRQIDAQNRYIESLPKSELDKLS